MKFLKRFFYGILILFYGILILLLTFVLLMFIPRIWSSMNPKKAPMGYYFPTPTIAAVYTGLESLIDKTPGVPENVEAIKNIEYKNINRQSLQMDFYIPKGLTKPAPLLVFIHGGGWRGGDRADYLVYLTHFAKLGFVTVTVSYRFLKVAPYPACVEDIIDARDFLYQNGDKYNYDPDRICLIGGSAGSHLAMLAAYGWKKKGTGADSIPAVASKHKIKAVVEIYGPVDFTTEYARVHPTITGFMVKSYKEAPQLYVEASPITYVTKDTPPTLILHGTRDMLVPIVQAEMLKHKMDSLGVPNVYCPVPGWPHTMDIVQRVNNYTKATMRDFFEKYVK